jgi:hypothetical protein
VKASSALSPRIEKLECVGAAHRRGKKTLIFAHWLRKQTYSEWKTTQSQFREYRAAEV